MSPANDAGTSKIAADVPNPLKEALYETAHYRRASMAEIVRESLQDWFSAQDDNPPEAIQQLAKIDPELVPPADEGVDVDMDELKEDE
jgi:hypothetical protein